MGALSSILKNKPLSPWQAAVAEEGRVCQECGNTLTITAPVSDSADMLRLQCDACGWLGYEFPPHEATIINFEDLVSNER